MLKSPALSGIVAFTTQLSPMMVLAIAILGGWLFIALAAPLIAPYDPDTIDIASMLTAPSADHWFGTDQVGRDVFSRVIYAARVDLFLCVIGVLPPLVIGTIVGLFSGYFGGMVDSVFMRVYDLTVAFPFFVLVLAIVGVIGPGLVNFIIALTIVGWVSYARLVRAEVLTVRESEFVRAAECLGYPRRAVLFQHVLPNAIGPVIAYAVSDAVLVMLAGASFGYLGMGAQPPLAEWGVIIADGQAFIQQAWWICLFPGLAAISLGLGFAFLGDGLGQWQRREVAA
ncbi:MULTISPECIES: ABC transporter permease [Ensifer]|jgi:peptide/nickel transport system permease protein|uniref:ABC transporter permease subunit n=2 Tax=Ensifer canadensis TaxID=555315 RepID=A0AAW4FEI8_9HYPH|nr:MULTISPECIES: ABC transporter permease [Ensifer]MBM3090497.1 ABC transporter permease subunit [Ensifer canadensis]UBI80865.1 ABC transporter permease [Ensifer canadensis]